MRGARARYERTSPCFTPQNGGQARPLTPGNPDHYSALTTIHCPPHIPNRTTVLLSSQKDGT